MIYHFASRGWLCVAPNYRLCPDATFPDPLVDIKRVIAWVRVHAAEYGGDQTQLFATATENGGVAGSIALRTLSTRSSSARPRRTGAYGNKDRRCFMYGPMRRRSPSCTATTIRSSSSRTRGISSERSARCPLEASSMPSCRGRSTRSTASNRFVAATSSTGSNASRRGFARRTRRATANAPTRGRQSATLPAPCALAMKPLVPGDPAPVPVWAGQSVQSPAYTGAGEVDGLVLKSVIAFVLSK
jgi:BD-FAE protein